MEILKTHFKISGHWDGDRNGMGTIISNGIKIPVSAPAEFDGPGIGSNPEELLLASAATCYIITLAFLLNRKAIDYTSLDINTEGITHEEGKRLSYKAIIHRPVITLKKEDEDKKEIVEKIAERAEKGCFIGQTLKPNLDISVEPDIRFI